jgi:hypothetical protein
VQGMVTFEDVEELDACLGVLQGSHRFHEEYCREVSSSELLPRRVMSHPSCDPCPHDVLWSVQVRGGLEVLNDWHQITTKHVKWFQSKGCRWRNIVAPRGSLVLWDSRTFHMGTPIQALEVVESGQPPGLRA